MFTSLSTLASGYLLLSGSTAHAPEDMVVLAHCLAAGCRLSHMTLSFLGCLFSSVALCFNSSSPTVLVALTSSVELHTSNSQWPLIILYAVKTFWRLWEINVPLTVNHGSY